MANSQQKKIEKIRPGTVFMFVDKSGHVVKAKEFDEHEYSIKEARRLNNSSLQKSVTQTSKSYTASVQQRALQIVNDSTKSQNVSEQKKSPHYSETLRISSGKCARPKVNGDHKDIPVKESSLKKRLQKKSYQEPLGIDRNQSKNQTHQREKKAKTKTKSEPDSADEKALVKAKPKRTRTKPSSCRKPSGKLAVDTLTPLNDNGGDTDGVWFKCNVPFRVKIPFPIFTKKLFGMKPLPAGCSTIPKGKDFVDEGLERKVGCPPSFPSMCITMIPGTNPNTSPDQWTSSQLEQLNETTGTPKKKLKGIKRCSVCETCTQTGFSTNEKAPSDPVLSCLEQIREHLSTENENAQKNEMLKQKYTCRFFAEKSTSVRSLQSTANENSGPNAAATNNNRKKQFKESKETKEPKNIEYSSERTEPSIFYNRYPKCPTTRISKVCNAAVFKQSPVSGHVHREAPLAHEPKRYTPDNGFLGSGNVSVSRGRHISHQQQYQVEGGSNNSGQDATSNNSRNSDNDNERCSTTCRPEGGVSDTQWNDKHTGATIRKEDSFYDDESQASHKSQQSKGGRAGRALKRDDEPQRMSERMNDFKAKENRIKQRSKSAPANIKYRDGSHYYRVPPMVRPNGGNPKVIDHVVRQVSDRSEEDVYATIMSSNMKIFVNKRCSPQEQPVLLMPFRVENKNIGQGKAKEWRKLTLTNVTKVTPNQFRIVSGYANGSSRVPKASPPYARAVPRRAPPPAVQCRSSQGQTQSRAYPTSALRCPRHPNGPISNRNRRNPSACNRFRTAAPRNREQLQSEYREVAFGYRASRQPAVSAGSSHNTGPSAVPTQRWVNASIGSSCAIDSTSIQFQHSAERSLGVSQQTLTEQNQCPPCLAACRPQCNERSMETVTLMQPRPLRSTESFQSGNYEDQGATAMENQLQPGFGPPECHFGSRQCTGGPPSMGDFGINQQEFLMGNGYQSNPAIQHAQQYICTGSVCSHSTGLIDPRHLLPTVSASVQSNQVPMGVYQCHQPVQCQQPTDMYGNQSPFYSPEDLKESIRIMPMGFYEQTINKYKINPLDSNFRPPSLHESLLQHLQQQMEVTACSISSQSQQQQPQHGSSACSCPYIMPQNSYPQQQHSQQEMQFQDFDQTTIQ
ncbi:uncharacterized protein LOC117580064 isoform X1 [Drosophila guanche]|uniref:uncharacterized protein LOC117580064 isoform X1 n=1 Tax=Drosophila guanche TaxID=7266 RepID=UPI001470DECE|nr:uncharacterized protein LOC117580064 isoform X1 [Drosophila guanche]